MTIYYSTDEFMAALKADRVCGFLDCTNVVEEPHFKWSMCNACRDEDFD